MTSSNIKINNDNISKLSEIFNMFGTNDSNDIKHFKIYGYQINQDTQKGMIFLGSSQIKMEMSLSIQNSIHYYSDEGYSELGVFDTQQVLNQELDKINRNYIGEDIDKTFSEEFASSDQSANMIEFVNSELDKRIQIVQSDSGFNIFYIINGDFVRYEEYHLYPSQVDVVFDDESLSVIKVMLKNVVDKYNLKFANKILAIWKIEDMDLSSDEEDFDMSDTEKEMRELGIYNELEGSDDESEESNSISSDDDNDDTEDDDDDDEIRMGSIVVEESESDSNDDSESEVDSDLERILMG